MLKLIVAYRHPTDAAEFERRYQGEHVAMAKAIPHASRFELGKVTGGMDGSKAPYHRIAEFYFDNQEALGRAGSSTEGQAAFKHAGEIGTGGLDVMVVEIEG